MKWPLTLGYGYGVASIDDSRKGLREYRYNPLYRLEAVRGDIGENFQYAPRRQPARTDRAAPTE